MKILFTGGGTMGPVMPLLAVWEAWKNIDPKVEAVWVGTSRGPERSVVEAQGIPFFTLPVVRLPRYPSLEWITMPFTFLLALYKGTQILRSQKIRLVASAGGYTAVPVIYAAKLLGVNVWVHQQDVEITKTTKLTVPFADLVTVAWERNRNDLGDRAKLVGNPVRPSLLQGSRERAYNEFKIGRHKPSVLVMGGGTGSAWINQAVDTIVGDLAQQANVIHLTGRGKGIESNHPDHHVTEFVDAEMADALAVADVVVCRAGLSTITELAALSKPAIMIPLPHSLQEANADMVADACVVLDQRRTTPEQLLEEIIALLESAQLRRELGAKMHGKLRTNIADELVEMLKTL
ncbi:UDP-N-acetylglucosamine--N-acetylmuramyl-(pentapeptide) pyrophosphoryl-undecaprenol N-acetylglucosamine transferase [Candidatus Uhrbacteria bacterium]|nr:UDP-N-acetylglucosamine--N-acetylmuramyl-(pentapeptide) pyrophosphoryl-undecaprenol N-acetylglucosamine transferase [Candidatus Uhrbacteria bacterium]